MVFQENISFSTSGHGDMHDLSDKVSAVVRKSGAKKGIVHVFAVGSTAGIGAIEWEPGLQEDLPAIFNKLIPPSRNYGHEQAWHDGNGHSHLQATILGPDLTIPFVDGKLLAGTWQQIVHVEFDVRERSREVVVTVMGE
ncbi:MAG TPA: secondary thiamine-phosphate synthase enzyme YjbQ [Bacteroidota bacterium]|nr:secondary thiamine-phosphate synthase enzyme YjbQ [Bacteroidota bacterium]